MNNIVRFIATCFTFTLLAGCYVPPTIVVESPDINIEVNVPEGEEPTPEPSDDDDSAEEVEDPTPEPTPEPEGALEITYLGPNPGTGINPGECGVIAEMELSAVNGEAHLASHRFTLFNEGVSGSPFSSVTFLVDGMIHEDLVGLYPVNLTGDQYVFENNLLTIPQGITVVATYSGCVAADLVLDAQAASVQVGLDYQMWEADIDGIPVTFEEAFDYAHRVNIWGGEVVEEEDLCEPFEHYNVDDTMSFPVTQLTSTYMYYPQGQTTVSSTGAWYTAGGCGAGIVLNDVAIMISFEGLSELPDMTASLSLPTTGITTTCSSSLDYFGNQEVWCHFNGVELDVLPQAGAQFSYNLYDMPSELVEGDDVVVTVYNRWTDIQTGVQPNPNGWGVEEADSIIMAPYVN